MIEHWMQLITIQRATVTRSSMGGAVEVFANLAGAINIKAAVQNPTTRVQERYEKRGMEVSHSIYLEPLGVTIREGDKIVTEFGEETVIGVEDQAGLKVLWRLDTRLCQ